METMSKRMQGAGRALAKLHEIVIKTGISEIERDGMIQRFEFCFEILWKCGKDCLLEKEGLEAASPKKVIRLLRETGLFTDEETEMALNMANDRNLTSHMYDENMAMNLAKRIYAYEPLMQAWYQRMSKA